ncbi:hypothetical protein EniLVp02_0095 [Vibrio phage EniLVp02]
MNNAIKTIIADLNNVFAPMDADVLKDTLRWALERRDAVKAFRSSDEYQKLRRDPFAAYAELYRIAGGKVWYNALHGNSNEAIEKFVAKSCAATVAKRNNTIAKKLAKAEVTRVIESKFENTDDGFNGVFVVETNAGTKSVNINTIIAGGYNIQCLHLRVLTKIK